jgi:TPR repeat protein
MRVLCKKSTRRDLDIRQLLAEWSRKSALEMLRRGSIIDLGLSSSREAYGVLLTGKSRRTLWRRVSNGSVARVVKDSRGCTQLSLDEVVPSMPTVFDSLDLELVLETDSGDADAIHDLGQTFALVSMYEAAKECWELASAKSHPDAMQSLGALYIDGRVEIKDPKIGVMWIAKASAEGHKAAEEQMRLLLNRRA